MITVEHIDGFEVRTEYTMSYCWSGEDGGFGFPCDKQGNVCEAEMNPLGREHYRKCLDGTYDVEKRGIEKYVTRSRLCSCGSGEVPSRHYDARGIFLTFACDTCESEKLGRYRADVLTDCNYQTDEPIDEAD